MTVLVLGGAGVDHVAYVPSLPLPVADTIHVPSVHTRAAQTGDFVAVGLHALGVPVVHLDVIGDDVEGQLVRDLHSRAGVPFVAVTTAAGTKRSINLVDPGGRRLSLYDGSRGDGIPPFPAEVLEPLVPGARHAHVCITPPCDSAIPVLRAGGLTISTDLHDWDGRNPYHRVYADGADIVFLSAAALLPDPVPAMRSLNARIVVATAGAEGGWALVDGEVSRFAAVAPPAPVVDSNGVGDAFAAGFLAAYLGGEPVSRCLALGATAGAHACTVPATEVNPYQPQRLRFRAGHLAAVRSGSKRVTMRFEDPVQVGPALLVFEFEDEVVLPGRITSTVARRVESVTDDEAREDGFAGAADVLPGLRDYYPRLRPEDEIVIVRFEVSGEGVEQ